MAASCARNPLCLPPAFAASYALDIEVDGRPNIRTDSSAHHARVPALGGGGVGAQAARAVVGGQLHQPGAGLAAGVGGIAAALGKGAAGRQAETPAAARAGLLSGLSRGVQERVHIEALKPNGFKRTKIQ